MMPMILLKAHVKGHMRGGKYVNAYETKKPAGKQQAQPGLFGAHGAPTKPKGPPPGSVPHPMADHHGEPVHIHRPTKATDKASWADPKAIATFTPGGPVPAELNGVPLAPWTDHPTTDEGWDYTDLVDDDLEEPAFHVPDGKKASSGVLIEEPDGRVWLVSPTNGFGGYRSTFPKGTAEPELSLQANAVKEVFEELGLKVQITGFVADVKRTTSVARIYRGVRVGGTPAAMGWESQAAHLVPKGKLYDLLNMDTDHPIAEAAGAGESPKPQKPAKGGKADLFDF